MKRTIVLICIMLGVLGSVPRTALGAELSVEPDLDHEGPGFAVRLVLRYDHPINAVQGVLRYDPEHVRIHRIVESPEGVPLWVQRPQIREAGILEFAGIFPGGIEPRLQDRLSLMEVTFEVLAPGESELALSDVRVLLNTAVPEDDEVTLLPVLVRMSESDIGEPVVPEDRIPPEDFTVDIVTDGSLGDGAPLAVFRTRDLQSGLASYDIRERFLGLWGPARPADSPAELSPLWRWSIIEVRATDRAGNHTAARHVPVSLLALYGVAGVLTFWRLRRWRRT